MANNVRSSLATFLVRNTAGQYDLNASVSKFSALASKEIASQNAEEESISKTLHVVFDQHLGAKMNHDFIASEIMKQMTAETPALGAPAFHAAFKERVLNVVRAQTEAGVLASDKGKGGGTYRVADQTPAK